MSEFGPNSEEAIFVKKVCRWGEAPAVKATRTDGFGSKWGLARLDRLSRRSRLAGAEIFKENVGQHPHLARG